MDYTVVALKRKIMEMYPEIEKNDILMGLVFNEGKDTYFVNFRKGPNVFATHLQKNETDACMDGVRFTHLGSQIGRWMKNFVVNKTQATDMLVGQGSWHQEKDHGHYRGPGSTKEDQWVTQLLR